jgi:hypothetical protein
VKPLSVGSDLRGEVVRLILAGLALNALLVLPAWWRDGALEVWIAPEAWLLPALLSLRGRPIAGWVRTIMSVLLAFVVVAGLFNGLVQSVLSRPLNVVIDPLMLAAGFHLVDGSFGFLWAVLASLAVATAAVGIVWGVDRLLRIGSASGHPRSGAVVAGLGAVFLLLSSLGASGVESQVVALASEQWREVERTQAARQRLVEATSEPSFEVRPLPGLAGRDVYVVFIESYGVTLFEESGYRSAIVPRLAGWRQAINEAGLQVVSGRVVAPIRGGQSWLSHASLLSGLPIDNQLWYRSLLERDIGLLSEDFRATGHTAINLAPAIVRDWPEGRRLGFDRIYAAESLGYEGPSLGWVTMPDEFTLHSLSHRIRPHLAGPVFAQVALISSHWPWRPILSLTDDPARIDNGAVYADQAVDQGLSVFEQFDLERLRRDYVLSVGYSLDATLDWAGRELPRDALLVVLGDHQPVSLVTGRDASASVPVHVISGEGALLDPFRRRGFVTGLRPAVEGEIPALHELRHWLRAAFGAR